MGAAVLEALGSVAGFAAGACVGKSSRTRLEVSPQPFPDISPFL